MLILPQKLNWQFYNQFMFLVNNVHEWAGLQTQACSNMPHSNAVNHSFLCRRACHDSLFIKKTRCMSGLIFYVPACHCIQCLIFFSYSHILDKMFSWLSVLGKGKSSSQYTLNEKTFVMLYSFFPRKYVLINLVFCWKSLINFSV